MFNDYFIFATHLFDCFWAWSLMTNEKLAALSLLFVFGLLFCLEVHFPRHQWPVREWLQSCKTNFSLFLFNNTLLSLLSVSTLLMLAEQYSVNGMLSQFFNPTEKFIVSFLLIDFILYVWHVGCHKFDSLWMFHKVHHSDAYLNVTTAFRLHTIELIIVTFLKASLIVFFGIDKMTVLITETITTLFVMFHHTNISFAAERWMSSLVIVPFLHRLHHSTERDEHDSNYGAVLSVWDRIFGTLLNKEPLAIGIKYNSSPGFLEQLKFGFTKVLTPIKGLANIFDDHQLHIMICEAAYFNAINRGFNPGSELDDWLRAEKEIKNQVIRKKAKQINNHVKKRKPLFHMPNWSTSNNLIPDTVAA